MLPSSFEDSLSCPRTEPAAVGCGVALPARGRCLVRVHTCISVAGSLRSFGLGLAAKRSGVGEGAVSGVGGRGEWDEPLVGGCRGGEICRRSGVVRLTSCWRLGVWDLCLTQFYQALFLSRAMPHSVVACDFFQIQSSSDWLVLFSFLFSPMPVWFSVADVAFGWPCFGLDGRLFFWCGFLHACLDFCWRCYFWFWIFVVFGVVFFVLTFSVCNTRVFFKIIFVHHWSSVSEWRI